MALMVFNSLATSPLKETPPIFHLLFRVFSDMVAWRIGGSKLCTPVETRSEEKLPEGIPQPVSEGV